MSSAESKIIVKLVRSPIAAKPSHKACVKSLGLRKLNSMAELPRTPQVMGIIHEIRHLVQIVGS